MIDTLPIEVQTAKQSRISELDVNNLPFGKAFADHMFIVDYKDDAWQQPRIVPFGNLTMSPATSALHYGQTIFEGMKAHKSDKGEVLLFRPLENHKRINISAARMCMPSVPEKIWMEGLVNLLRLDSEWVFQNEGCSLYIRPFMFAIDEFIGVRASKSYRFMIFCSPSGPYFKDPVKVLIETKYTRASEGGVGFTKAAANYGISLYPTKLAQDKGYHQIIWTDAKEHKYIDEAGMMNVMFVINNVLVTPDLSTNTILAGITRDSLMTIAKDWGMKVEERRISVQELMNAYQNNILQEAFGCGTAATVAHISTIGYKGKDYVLPPITDNSFSKKVANHLTDIRRGRVEDIHNWTYKV